MGEVKEKRNPSFELLRVVSMLMIVTLHYNAFTGALMHHGVPASGVNIAATIFQSFAITGVNTYVLLTGFFMSKQSPKVSKLLQLICTVYFYTVLISLSMMIVGTYVLHSGNSVYKMVQYLFPISDEHYWFVTAYVIMYVLSPVLNAAVMTMRRNQLKFVIIGLLVWFSVIKSVVPVVLSTDRYGYDYGWFICLYLIAAYMRKYDVVLFCNAKRSAIVFLISGTVIALMSFVLYYVNYRTGGLVHYSQVPMHYNFIFTLTGSLGLFSFFRFYKMKEGRAADVVRFLGPLTFGVYLLHMHLEIKDRWIGWLESFLGEVPLDSVPLFIWHALWSVVIVFAAGIFVDWIRKMIFDYVERVLHDTRLFEKIRQWDKELC